MDLGYKTLNNLTSKDFALQKQASSLIINTKDVKAFEILEEKSEFIFDFIKEKIVQNLINATNETNVINLFDFMKIYSDDFKDFILKPLIKFNSKEIEDKIFKILENGTEDEKAYALEYCTKTKNTNSLSYAKKYVTSEYTSLKKVSIELLKEFNDKENYEKSIEIINSNVSDYEKMEAVEFLSYYKDEKSFDIVYDYLKKSGANEFIALNLLSIKDINDLIKEEKSDEIFTILSSIFFNFPDNVSYDDVSYYLNGNLFNFLMEESDDFAQLLMLYIKNKVEFLLNEEAYSVDLDKNAKKEAQHLINDLGCFIQGLDKKEAIKNALNKSAKAQIFVGIELFEKEEKETLENLIRKTDDNEIILFGINALKQQGVLDNSFILEIQNKVTNETVKLELKNYCA